MFHARLKKRGFGAKKIPPLLLLHPSIPSLFPTVRFFVVFLWLSPGKYPCVSFFFASVLALVICSSLGMGEMLVL